MSEITFNVNHKVKAKLNDRGRKIQAEYYAPFGDGPKPDSDGWTEYQMWCLMHVFGEHCYMGPEPPFETNIRIIVDDPDLSALRAEVERYKRAVRLAAEAAWDGDPRRAQEIDLAVQQAIAEAGKE